MLHLIVNPIAGNGRCAALAERIEEALRAKGFAFETQQTLRPGHAEELARRVAQTGAPLVLCAGGDGTAFEAAHGLIGSKTALGILPCGTGNDFTRMLALPAKAEEAALALLKGHAQPIDVGYINGHLFLNSCGAGFDAQTVQAAQKAKFLGRGMLPYLYGVFDTLAHYKPLEMTIQTDDAPPFTQRCLLCIVANGQFIGGGMQIAPCARFDDGLFDLLYVDPLPRRKIVRLLPEMIRGKHMRFTEIVHHIRCRSVRIDCPDMLMQCDGELQTLNSASFSLTPARLLLQVP